MHTLENILDLISQVCSAMEMNQNCWIAATQTQQLADPLVQLEFAVKEKQFQVNEILFLVSLCVGGTKVATGQHMP